MEDWEFLIQKEGDASWLPLESADVEILEGRYRVIARSNRTNERVEIRLIHKSSDEVPPNRWVQKHFRRTSPEGLIVVLPFTRLKPGIWDLRCSGTEDSPQGTLWYHSVRLQVLPTDAEDAEPLNSPYSEVPAKADTSVSPWQPPSSRAVPAETPPPKRPQLIPLPPNPGTAGSKVVPLRPPEAAGSPPPAEPAPPPAPPPAPLPPAPPPAPPAPRLPLQLTLNRETYVVHRGESVTLSGRVIAGDGAAGTAPLSASELHIQLRNPQSSQVLAEVRETLPSLPPPVPFSCTVQIPVDCPSHLILGEIRLYSGTPEILDAKSFVITAAAEELLGAVSPQLSQQELVDLSLDPLGKLQAQVLKNHFQELQDSFQKTQPLQFQPSSDPALPPLLSKPNPEKLASKGLDLPGFRRLSRHAPIAKQPPPPAPKQPPPPPNPAEPVSPWEADPLPEPGVSLSEGEVAGLALPQLPPKTPPPPVDTAFQSLQVQNRFLSKLNAMAKDEDLAEWLKIESQQEEEQRSLAKSQEVPAPKTVADWEAQEVVVYDEPVLTPQPPEETPPPDIPPPLLLPANEQVPVPVLQVPEGELISGRKVKVAVRLPELQPRIYVKIWVQDRQARLLLEGPLWLTEFYLNLWGDKEATIDFVVPHGTLEVQFEAIAMEMHTGRESRKVSVSRRVMPPPPPTLPHSSENF
ncbi:hypothetical protein [Kamptonema formosum]|uniref:hypothetical protein n=1 Tax=Kamptonema formosum TaxID=331992 RepID=UPI0003490E75|nr:hypothetical protein [Oscillatoria sp. PCC 10802]